MDALLSPGWLAGLAALAVPLAVHWLSRGRGRVVRVGSTRLLTAAETRSLRRLRLTDRPLLLARVALVAGVVLALSEPTWQRPARRGEDAAPRLLVEPAVLGARGRLEPDNPESYRRLDELLAGGASGRWLAEGLAPLDGAPPAAPEDLWSLLREAATPGAALEVFALDRLAALRGERPGLPVPVVWHALRDGASERWLDRAWRRQDGEIEAWVGETSSSATAVERTRFTPAAVPAGLELAPGGTGVRLSGDGGELVRLAAPPPLAAWIARDESRRGDARYVRAALAAIAERAGRSLEVAEVEAVGGVGDGVPALGPLFWLSARPVPEPVRRAVAAGALLLSDAGGLSESCAARVALPPPLAGSLVAWRLCGEVDAAPPGVEAVLWRGAAGPLLAASRVGAGVWLRLRGRLDPAFSDLPLQPGFAHWLESLVEWPADPSQAGSEARDLRAAGADQARPRDARGTSGATPRRALEWPLWALVAGLLALERWMSGRRR